METKGSHVLSSIPPASGRTGSGVESGFPVCILMTKNLSGVLQLLAGAGSAYPCWRLVPGLVRLPPATLSGPQLCPAGSCGPFFQLPFGARWLVRVAQGPMELPSPACHGNAQCKQVSQCSWVCQLEPGAMGGQRWSSRAGQERAGLTGSGGA